MEIILKEDILGLGFKNDIVNVKSGYGRNYLIPTGKAVIASPMAKKQLAEDMKQQAHKLAALKEKAEKRAGELKDVALVIPAKVSATGVLYGSVNVSSVVEALKEKGIEIDRKIIIMKDIKKVGEYAASVHFHKDVTVEIPVTVVPDDESKAAQEAAKKAAAEQAKADEARKAAKAAESNAEEAAEETAEDAAQEAKEESAE